MQLSKKQHNLIQDIVSTDINEIYILGSTQSGKTYSISLGTILYAQKLNELYPNEEFNGAIVGWSVSTMKKNILEEMVRFLEDEWKIKKGTIFDYKWNMQEKWIKIYNITFTFFPFNNVLSFNNILGRPLIFIWVDEAARIYTQKQLQEQFNQFPGRQMSYANNKLLKTIHSFNVEGNENHDYKKDYLEKKTKAKQYVFFPYDNPKINTPEAIRKVVELFPPGSLREQKVFNKWVVAEGLVFNKIPKISYDEFKEWTIRDMVIAIDYGSVHPTVMTPLVLCWNSKTNQWRVFRIETYYHDPTREGTTPTTEFFSNQLQMFIRYLGGKYENVKLTNIPIDSAAAHFHNRLITDGIAHELVNKDSMTVNESVELMRSLFEKEYLVIVDMPSIRYFQNDGTPVYSGKDDSAIEIASYQYDKIKSFNTGQNIYKKDKDDATDSIRYGVMVLRDTGRIPDV